MKLKPLVVSVMLSTLSGTAFAAVSHEHHHPYSVPALPALTAAPNVQSRLNAMQAEINQMQQVINQNNGGTTRAGGTALQSTLANSSAWYNAISVSGLLNADAIASSRTPLTETKKGNWTPVNSYGKNSSTDFALSNADLFVDAQINDWTKAHVGLNYQSNQVTEASKFKADNAPIVTQNISGPLFDEAYITIGNFSESPFYFRAGKQYVNFGNYDRYAMVPSFTQLLTETNENAATLGFVTNQGVYGSVYGFRGTPKYVDMGHKVNVNNFGANIGFMQHNSQYGFNLQASYLNNIADVEYINDSSWGGVVVNNYNVIDNQQIVAHDRQVTHVSDDTTIYNNGYLDRVGGLSLDASANINIFDMYAHYVTSLGTYTFGPEVTTNTTYNRNTNELDIASFTNQLGGRLQALNVGAGVTFDVLNHASRFGVDYQHSWNAQLVGFTGLPQQRYEATYNIGVSKNVNVGVDIYHDQDYPLNDVYNTTGRSSNTGVLRLGVMFA